MQGDRVKAVKKRKGRGRLHGESSPKKAEAADIAAKAKSEEKASGTEEKAESAEKANSTGKAEAADVAAEEASAEETRGTGKAESAEKACGTEEKAESAEKASDIEEKASAEAADIAAEEASAEETRGTEEEASAEAADVAAEEVSEEAANGVEEAESQAHIEETDGVVRTDSREPEGRDDEEDEEDDDDWEKDDDLPDDWEEESGASRPWVMALVFLAMVFAAAGICIMLWSFTHSDKREGQKLPAGTGAASGSGEGFDPDGKAPSGTGNQGDDAASASKSGENDVSEQALDLNRVTTQDGRVIIFTDCDDMVTPKEYVNLRTEPSTSQGEATVGCRLNQGEEAHRTGISEEMGWSRVEYNGQVLYVVTSFVSVVKDTPAAE